MYIKHFTRLMVACFCFQQTPNKLYFVHCTLLHVACKTSFCIVYFFLKIESSVMTDKNQCCYFYIRRFHGMNRLTSFARKYVKQHWNWKLFWYPLGFGFDLKYHIMALWGTISKRVLLYCNGSIKALKETEE